MKKPFKDIMLIVSVLTAFVLVCQIWFSSFFLPGGYEFFVSGFRQYVVSPVKNLLKQMSGGDFSQNLKALYQPETIVLHSSGERRAYTKGTKGFTEAFLLSNEVMQELLSGAYPVKSREIVDIDTYHSVLKGKSIYVNYGKNCDYRLFSFSISGETQNRFAEDLSTVRSYIISLQDGIMNNISFFVTDQKSGNAYRYVVEADKNALDLRLTELIQSTEKTNPLSYSFELNFHKLQEQTPTKILFEPSVLMELSQVQLPSVKSHVADFFGAEIDNEFLEDILRTFSINTRSVWRYTDLSNARVFVENDATLTLSADGYLEYQAVGDGRGLDISGGKNSYDIYAATTDAVDFVTELCQNIPDDYFDHLRIQTDLVDDASRQGVYKICFDYCIGGVPVRYQIGDRYAHAIEIEIVGGYLQAYRQYVKLYENTEDTPNVLMPVLQAADLLVDRQYNGTDPLYVSEIEPCYVDVVSEADLILPMWRAMVDDGEQIIG